jgi:hypothetical protein
MRFTIFLFNGKGIMVSAEILKKIGARPVEVEPYLVVYSAMLVAILAFKTSGLPIPNPTGDNDTWSSNSQLKELRSPFQNGELVAFNAATMAFNYIKAVSKYDKKKNPIDLQMMIIFKRFQFIKKRLQSFLHVCWC